MPTQQDVLTDLVRKEELQRTGTTAPVTALYLKSLSSQIMNHLCNEEDVDSPGLRKHLIDPLRNRLKSDHTLATISGLNLETIDVSLDIDESGQQAKAWCLNRRGFHKSLSRESVAVFYWELRDHRVWLCVDIKVMSGGVGF